jgi:hypothetical protein
MIKIKKIDVQQKQQLSRKYSFSINFKFFQSILNKQHTQ